MLMTRSELVWFVTCPPVYGRNPLSRMAHLRHAFADMVFRRLAGVDHLRFASENIVAPASLVPKQERYPSQEVPECSNGPSARLALLAAIRPCPKWTDHVMRTRRRLVWL